MNGVSRLGLLFHTVRYLKPRQVYGRAVFRLSSPNPEPGPPPPRREASGNWTDPARKAQSLFGPARFRFLNAEGDLGSGWDDPSADLLWRYNLHYFDDLNAVNAEERFHWHDALLSRWIDDNPPGRGTGWDPYPTSLRIVNWIKWAQAGNPLSVKAVGSLAIQVRWLNRRLEHHLLGNHLFANAKALVFAGLFFGGAEAEGWLVRGAEILQREVPEQILGDGGHFELSPMYHALALEDVLDLINIGRACGDVGAPVVWRAVARQLEDKVGDMLNWLAAMSHPDDGIAFFNDAAMGIAPANHELRTYATRLGINAGSVPRSASVWLRQSGYVRLQKGTAVALLDVAAIGPDYLPGHAHADTLSFELSVGQSRVLVNSGTSLYGNGPERLRQRGTAAHNTVVVGGENSSEVWSGFRVARRACPRNLRVDSNGAASVTCRHDGYRRLRGRPVHSRSWSMTDNGLRIVDVLEGGSHSAEARFHFHPDTSVDLVGNAGSAVLETTEVLRWNVKQGTAHLEPATWHPEFGVSRPTQCLVVSLFDGTSDVHFHWNETPRQ